MTVILDLTDYFKSKERKEGYYLDSLSEKERLYQMTEYERAYSNLSYIAGVDEAGRGPLAGPVVAAAVILPKDCEILYLNDSKKLSDKKRRLLFEEIKEKAISYGIGIVSEKIIDEINILQATYLAMQKAIRELKIKPDILLNDAVIIPGIETEQVKIIKGDAKSVSIAAASILAKVTRDDGMIELAKTYPDYGFEKHKGYGTKAHYAALDEFGVSPVHRLSYLKKYFENKV